jgi:hypothetical protein
MGVNTIKSASMHNHIYTRDMHQVTRSKRRSPYSENDIWDRDELLTIIKYEPEIRNKAALMLFWDLDARNH